MFPIPQILNPSTVNLGPSPVYPPCIKFSKLSPRNSIQPFSDHRPSQLTTRTDSTRASSLTNISRPNPTSILSVLPLYLRYLSKPNPPLLSTKTQAKCRVHILYISPGVQSARRPPPINPPQQCYACCKHGSASEMVALPFVRAWLFIGSSPVNRPPPHLFLVKCAWSYFIKQFLF